jgi:hypothetical protein
MQRGRRDRYLYPDKAKEMNPRQFLIPVLLTALLSVSCKSRNEKAEVRQAEKTYPTGRYVNQTFLDEMADSLGFTPRYFCLQMHFVDSGRVFIDRGFEGDTLRYKFDGDAYRILQATSAGDMAFTIGGNGSLVLDDSAFTGTPRRSSFTKLGEGQDAAKAWNGMINERMASGGYEILDKGKASGKKAVLSSDGSVSGLNDYASYELCHTGDCLQTTSPYRHIMYLIKADGTRDTYAFTVEKGRAGLKIFKVGAPIPGTKGERKVLDLVYDLRRN